MKIFNLDCTLRDGGMALEFNNQVNNKYNLSFSFDDKNNFINHLSKTNIDIIELGILDISCKDECYSYYRDIKSVSNLIPKNKNNKIYAILINGPYYPLDKIPDYTNSNIDLIRFVIVYSMFEESLDYCRNLAKKGYKISIQPALTSRYNENQLLKLISLSNEIKAFSLYVVDTFGNLSVKDIKKVGDIFNKRLNHTTKLGIHTHNNFNLALSNSLSFIDYYQIHRDLIVDTCIYGMGLGAGNLQTELFHSITPEFYHIDSFRNLLCAAEVVSKFIDYCGWGYTVESLISAKLNASFKYTLQLRREFKLLYLDIFNIVSSFTNDQRLTYDKELVSKIIDL